MEQLIYTLLAYINNSLNKDINYHVAKGLLENIHELESFSLESAADACHVAPSTINRFCKRIGFRNFSSMRNSVNIPVGASLHEANNTPLHTNELFMQLNENLAIIDQIPIEQIDRIVQRIKKSNRIIILGFEKYQVQAMELQKKLLLLGKLSECGTNFFKQMDALTELDEDDLIITISIQGNILSSYFPFIEKFKAAKGQKLLITFSGELGKLAVFDEIIQCGKIENSSVSSYTLLRLFDVLFYRY
ncbi:MurR/RpiR family transcriptional regulator [Niallia taxi]|uniref:MurR/RpiR family transcriptional regulator n=1 Tax=Niallia taxi TaxID=2499688 RepID=UPI00300BCD00